MQVESLFQSKVIEEIQEMFPGAVIIKVDSNYIQGFPDRIILNENLWAALEFKKHEHARHQPNQDYYIDKLYSMSYASFVYPENKEKVLDELQQALRLTGSARFFRG